MHNFLGLENHFKGAQKYAVINKNILLHTFSHLFRGLQIYIKFLCDILPDYQHNIPLWNLNYWALKWRKTTPSCCEPKSESSHRNWNQRTESVA